MADLKHLDTQAFNEFIQNKDDYLKRYDEMQKEYNAIVNDLLKNWKGRGASSFKIDAAAVKTNISGIGDILQTMCDMLIDCRSVFEECDISIGKVNKDAAENK